MFRRSAAKKYFGAPVDPNSGNVPVLISRTVDFLNQREQPPIVSQHHKLNHQQQKRSASTCTPMHYVCEQTCRSLGCSV